MRFVSECGFSQGVQLINADNWIEKHPVADPLIGLRQSEQANRVVLWKVLGGSLAAPQS